MLRKLLNFFKKLPKAFIYPFKPKNIKALYKASANVLSFIFLLFVYLTYAFISKIALNKLFPRKLGTLILRPTKMIYDKVVYINRYKDYTINRVNLIEMALKNMRFKMTRTLITIGGMSVGIAAIVFLVSLGYGVEKLVTSRVARLDELKQADVFTQPGSNLRINDESMANLNNLEETRLVLPLIALVGKVNYNGSVTDMATYGATTEYLKQSAIKPVKGEVYESNDLSNNPSAKLKQQELSNLINSGTSASGEVAGATTKRVPVLYDQLQEIQFSIIPETWVEVRSSPLSNAKLLGYTKRPEGQQTGIEIWGEAYFGSAEFDGDSQEFGKWVNSKVFIWEKSGDEYVEKIADNGYQEQLEGYIRSGDLTNIKSMRVIESPQVLGARIAQNTANSNGDVLQSQVEADPSVSLTNVTSSEVSAVTTDGSSDTPAITEVEEGWVVIEGEGLSETKEVIQQVSLPESALREAVVNRAMLQLLNIKEDEAIGKEFDVSFIVTSDLLGNGEDKKESVFSKYKIVGVIPQDDTPYFYVPFYDLRGLGVQNYSQVKIVAKSENDLPIARQKVEALGYVTTSVVDTVSEINSLFSTVRKLLALIGTVALIVASLGMFNTLTVSLLERTREIGLMKALGMKSNEVEELFLTESMVMGLFGGIMGIVLGFIAGKVVGVILSAVAITKGVGFVDVSSIPMSFVVLIIGLSIIVGLVTGIYPAKRATRISALNALRYE